MGIKDIVWEKYKDFSTKVGLRPNVLILNSSKYNEVLGEVCKDSTCIEEPRIFGMKITNSTGATDSVEVGYVLE